MVPTVCTADLDERPAGSQPRVQRASAAGRQGARAALDEAGWAACGKPARRGVPAPAIDVTLAERLIADPALYAAALQSVGRTAQTAAATPDQPALTGIGRALSSRPR